MTEVMELVAIYFAFFVSSTLAIPFDAIPR